MGVKRWGSLIRLCTLSQPKGRSQWTQQKATDRKVYQRNDASRMRREFHVRLYEGLGVKFPGATRQLSLYPAKEAKNLLSVKSAEVYLGLHNCLLKTQLLPIFLSCVVQSR